MRTRFAAAAMSLALLSSLAAPASAADFTFTFASDLSDPDNVNDVAGSVTGRILGLADNGTSSAVSVIIDSYNAAGFGSFPTDAALWENQFVNSFTVVNGQITAASFRADRTQAGSYDQLWINIPLGYARGNTNYASTGVNNTQSIWNNTGLSGVSFTAVDSLGVPEPATWALMILGFGAVGGAMRRCQSVAAKVRFA